MKLRDLIEKIEKKYPLFLAESWDNVGLMIGDENQQIKKILVSLEANEAVIREAIENKVDLIVTHHPFFFSKMNQINTNTIKGRLALLMIQNNISLYSMHTNYDIAFDGMNDNFLKHIGLIANDSFMLVQASDWYVKEHGQTVPGLGRIAKLKESISLRELCTNIKEKLSLKSLRVIGDLDASIQTVAVITGSSADYYKEAKEAGADVLIAGDAKYHLAHDILDAKMNVIDCGHFETEDIFKYDMKEYLSSVCDCDVISTSVNLNPFQLF